VARFRPYRRFGAIGIALTAWDIWRRIPPRHRKTIIKQARKHGPTLAARIVQGGRRRHR
jgi:hypothetical protein